MSINRIIFGCDGFESLNSYRRIINLVDFIVDSGIYQFDTAPTYYWGYAEKYLSKCPKSIRITSKLTLNKMPNTWVPKQIFPLFYRLINRKYLRKILDTIYTVRIYNSVSTESMNQCLEKSLNSCGIEKLSCYLLHGISQSLWTNELISFLNSSKAHQLTSKIGISIEGSESLSELETIIINNDWIDTIQLSVSNDSYTIDNLIDFTNQYRNIEFIARGFYKAFGKTQAIIQIKNFLSKSNVNSKIIYSSSNKEHIKELIASLCKLN